MSMPFVSEPAHWEDFGYECDSECSEEEDEEEEYFHGDESFQASGKNRAGSIIKRSPRMARPKSRNGSGRRSTTTGPLHNTSSKSSMKHQQQDSTHHRRRK